jgi:SAUR family protein
MMKRWTHGGLRLRRKLLGFWRWALCSRGRYLRLRTCSSDVNDCTAKKLTPVLQWGRSLARRLSLGWRSGGTRTLDNGEKAATTPSGRVVLCVGGAAPGESMRYVVPVVYFNHPVFGELLKEAEQEFGFQHPTASPSHAPPCGSSASLPPRPPHYRREEGIQQVVASSLSLLNQSSH